MMSAKTRLLLASSVLTIASAAFAVHLTSGSVAVSRGCSVASILSEYNIELFGGADSATAEWSVALGGVNDLYPHAEALEGTTGFLTSDQIPSVSGRRATVIIIAGAPLVQPAGTPPPNDVGPDAGEPLWTCTAAVVDADTGELIVSMQDVYLK